MNPVFALIAQAPTPTGPPPPTAMNFLFPAALFALVVFMRLRARSPKTRERRAREAMFAGMSRNDRVQTVGGVIGTVLSIKDNEIVLKVDESTNTKMTFVKTSVQRILTSESTAGTGS